MTHDEQVLLEGARFRVVRAEYCDDHGRRHVRDIVRHPGAVVVLPWMDDGRVCLIKNFRAAVDETLIELPAGTLESGEDPARTAERELLEETGFRAARVEHLHTFFTSPGVLDERMHLFLASGLTRERPAREAGEQIENLPLPWDEALQLVDSGRIRDAKTLVGLMFYERRREREPALE